MNPRTRAWLSALIATALFAAALYVLHGELSTVRVRDVAAALRALPARSVLAGLVLTVVNYAILTGFDQLAFRVIGRAVAPWRIALASFVGYAISNTLGFALISGTSIRYRFYSRWGIGAADLSRIVIFYSSSFWLGLLALGGFSLAFHPHPALQTHASAITLRALGIVLIAIAAGYLIAAMARPRPVEIRGVALQLPPPRMAFAQFALSLLDWILAAAVLFVLLPAGAPPFGVLIGIFLGAQLIGLVSHVPGGIGVFDSVMLIALGDYLPPQQILSSLLLYRVIYYLGPLTGALAILVADEARIRQRQLLRVGAVFGGLTRQLATRVLAVFTFLAGVLLLFSGALPADARRLHALDRFFPLAVFEASHFVGSIIGVALLLIAQGVARRLDAAYYAAVAALGVGIAASLLKGGDYEEALLLAALLVAFLPTRREFDRRAAFYDARFSPGWTFAAIAAVGASIWLGVFAFKHVEYQDELWWRFALDHDVSRFLRASVGATVGLLGFGIARLVRPMPPELPLPDAADLDDAARIIAQQPATLPLLALLGDKALLFNGDRTAFLMYGVRGRTWVALGDPVGPAAEAPALAAAFLERADEFGGVPAFYQVSGASLPMYVDLGLTSVKLGEEARVDLSGFSVQGHAQRGVRNLMNRMERDGVVFDVLAAEDVPRLMPQLRAVSNSWLADRKTAEKGFSLGFFDPAYIARFPIAVMRRGDEVIAFANVWLGADGAEMSVDLMRFGETAPKSVMETLFAHLMGWGRAHGYHWFSLGMAPLSGLQSGPFAHPWSRFGHWVFRYGEAFYNFQGVRAFKEKFDPVWTPRYLVYPGGIGLPRIFADITALVAGGYHRILR